MVCWLLAAYAVTGRQQFVKTGNEERIPMTLAT